MTFKLTRLLWLHLPQIIHYVRLILIKVKMQIYEIVYFQIVADSKVSFESLFHYLDEVDIEFTFNPGIADPAVFRLCIQLNQSLPFRLFLVFVIFIIFLDFYRALVIWKFWWQLNNIYYRRSFILVEGTCDVTVVLFSLYLKWFFGRFLFYFHFVL